MRPPTACPHCLTYLGILTDHSADSFLCDDGLLAWDSHARTWRKD